MARKGIQRRPVVHTRSPGYYAARAIQLRNRVKTWRTQKTHAHSVRTGQRPKYRNIKRSHARMGNGPNLLSSRSW